MNRPLTKAESCACSFGKYHRGVYISYSQLKRRWELRERGPDLKTKTFSWSRLLRHFKTMDEAVARKNDLVKCGAVDLGLIGIAPPIS